MGAAEGRLQRETKIMPKSVFFPFVILLALLTWAVGNWAYKQGYSRGRDAQFVEDRINEAKDRVRAATLKDDPIVNWTWGKEIK